MIFMPSVLNEEKDSKLLPDFHICLYKAHTSLNLLFLSCLLTHFLSVF